ncbi:MAG: prepilin-type N-terminal cleavage/methylation domain-containing protein [Planctomycetota bacterium]
MQDKRYKSGLTLVELLVALVVASIVLSAVATLAYAMGTANDVMGDTSHKQAQVRCATLRISKLIQHCKLICGTPGSDLAVWRADDNGDGQININELVYIERGDGEDYLRLCEFPPSAASLINLGDIETLVASDYGVSYVPLIPQCSNVQFSLDVLPPSTKFVSVSFEIVENGVVRRFQINAALRSWAGHLLNETGDALVSDDD